MGDKNGDNIVFDVNGRSNGGGGNRRFDTFNALVDDRIEQYDNLIAMIDRRERKNAENAESCSAGGDNGRRGDIIVRSALPGSNATNNNDNSIVITNLNDSVASATISKCQRLSTSVTSALLVPTPCFGWSDSSGAYLPLSSLRPQDRQRAVRRFRRAYEELCSAVATLRRGVVLDNRRDVQNVGRLLVQLPVIASTLQIDIDQSDTYRVTRDLRNSFPVSLSSSSSSSAVSAKKRQRECYYLMVDDDNSDNVRDKMSVQTDIQTEISQPSDSDDLFV